MERLDELKLKYQSALNTIKSKGVQLAHLHVQDDKLFLQGAAPSEDIKNEVWNEIKATDPSLSDISCDLSVDTTLPLPEPDQRTYTVVAGDSLWKIAQKLMGNGASYPKIIEANPGTLEDEKTVIHPGDILVIPAA